MATGNTGTRDWAEQCAACGVDAGNHYDNGPQFTPFPTRQFSARGRDPSFKYPDEIATARGGVMQMQGSTSTHDWAEVCTTCGEDMGKHKPNANGPSFCQRKTQSMFTSHNPRRFSARGRDQSFMYPDELALLQSANAAGYSLNGAAGYAMKGQGLVSPIAMQMRQRMAANPPKWLTPADDLVLVLVLVDAAACHKCGYPNEYHASNNCAQGWRCRQCAIFMAMA